MAKVAGRLAVLSKNSTPIGGVRVTKVKWQGESIDVTDKDSNGITELLSTLASESITLSVEGVYEDPVLRDIAFTTGTSKMLTDLSFKFSDGLTTADTITGNFLMTDYEESNSYDNATDFTCNFTSSGTWTLG